MFKKIKQTEVYKDKWLTLYHDDVELPDGTMGTYAWINRNNGVGVVPVTIDNKILLIKQYRYAIKKYCWEIPGGEIDPHESLENAGKRELYEETGVRAGEMIKIGTFYPLHSLNTETITVFYTIINSTDPNTLGEDAGEKIVEQEYFNFSEALKMIDNGEITDGMTANVIQIVIRKQQKNLSPSLK